MEGGAGMKEERKAQLMTALGTIDEELTNAKGFLNRGRPEELKAWDRLDLAQVRLRNEALRIMLATRKD
jgi:hypothetical protein